MAEAVEIDFIARMSEAWDLRGGHCFAAGGREHRALLALAGLPIALANVAWNDLNGDQRRRLIIAARHAVDLGRAAAWVFGEGNGA
jgi:hypothetical protein